MALREWPTRTSDFRIAARASRKVADFASLDRSTSFWLSQCLFFARIVLGIYVDHVKWTYAVNLHHGFYFGRA